MNTITFYIDRFRTNLKDVYGFIAKHQNNKGGLVVEINRAGAGDAFADHLEGAGFTVKRLLRDHHGDDAQ
jgi:hypothetical protein